MKRTKIREHIYAILFQIDFHAREELEELAELYLETLECKPKEREEIREKFLRIVEKCDVIDDMIADSAKDWTVERIAKAELAVLRLGIYEMLFDDDVPSGVAINEAVELAKKYGADKGAGFVNGILGTLERERAQ